MTGWTLCSLWRSYQLQCPNQLCVRSSVWGAWWGIWSSAATVVSSWEEKERKAVKCSGFWRPTRTLIGLQTDLTGSPRAARYILSMPLILWAVYPCGSGASVHLVLSAAQGTLQRFRPFFNVDETLNPSGLSLPFGCAIHMAFLPDASGVNNSQLSS